MLFAVIVACAKLFLQKAKQMGADFSACLMAVDVNNNKI